MAFLEGLQALSTDQIYMNHPGVLRFETTDMHLVFSEIETEQGSSVTSQLLRGQMRYQPQLERAAVEESRGKVEVIIPVDPGPRSMHLQT